MPEACFEQKQANLNFNKFKWVLVIEKQERDKICFLFVFNLCNTIFTKLLISCLKFAKWMHMLSKENFSDERWSESSQLSGFFFSMQNRCFRKSSCHLDITVRYKQTLCKEEGLFFFVIYRFYFHLEYLVINDFVIWVHKCKMFWEEIN